MNRLIFVAFLLQSLFISTISKCPDGMVPSYSDKTTCFLFVSQKQAFLPADLYCNQFGGHLASIHDAFDNVLIREEAQKNFTESTNGDFWIGLNSLETSGFSWIDGTSVNFVDWDKGQPSTMPGYNCVGLKLQGGMWAAADCDNLRPFVCIIKTSASAKTTTTSLPATTTLKPKTCPASWVYYDVTGFCYLVVNKATKWGDAEDWCFSQGGHLASIHSQAENSFVTNLIHFDPNDPGTSDEQVAFIGLYTNTYGANWRWSDDSLFDFAAWAPGKPTDHSDAFCGFIWNGPRWDAPAETWANWFCEEPYGHFVCKKQI